MNLDIYRPGGSAAVQALRTIRRRGASRAPQRGSFFGNRRDENEADAEAEAENQDKDEDWDEEEEKTRTRTRRAGQCVFSTARLKGEGGPMPTGSFGSGSALSETI